MAKSSANEAGPGQPQPRSGRDRSRAVSSGTSIEKSNLAKLCSNKRDSKCAKSGSDAKKPECEAPLGSKDGST